MNRSALALAAALSVAAFAAQAQDADPAGQYANSVLPSAVTRTQVQAELQQARTQPNPWSTSYNQLAGFRSQRTPAEVRAEYLASRNAVAALTSEDSGSAYLAAHRAVEAPSQFAGTPVNAQ